MLPASRDRILGSLSERNAVLDVGGWAEPFGRADWVIDLMPYETRGLYGAEPGEERFDSDTWVCRDICAHDRWPFADRQFDFVICSHTLEDLRDPIWVCAELNRVARAGYIEVPSRLEEQAWGVHGPWVGWSHHRWLCDVSPGRIEFAFKPGAIHGRDEFRLPQGFVDGLDAAERVQTLFWDAGFDYAERIFTEAEELDAYLAEFVDAHRAERGDPPRAAGKWHRSLHGLLERLRRR